MRVEFPWPSAAVSANGGHGHWASVAKARKVIREQAYWLTKNRVMDTPEFSVPEDGEIMLNITFNPPSRRRFDLDGLLTRSKSILDGFADALVVNDHRFAMTIRRGEPVPNGSVAIEVV